MVLGPVERQHTVAGQHKPMGLRQKSRMQTYLSKEAVTLGSRARAKVVLTAGPRF